MARYRLQALLLIKQRMKTKAELALAHAIQALLLARRLLEKLKNEKDKITEQWKRARREMKEKVSQGLFIGQGNVHVNYLKKLKEDEEKKEEEIEEQKEVVAEKEANVKKARKEYIDACKELSVMEKHKDLWEKKIRAEISRREEREMDELGNIIHRLRRMRGEKALGEI